MSKKGYLSEKEAIETLIKMGVTEHDGKLISAENFSRNELIKIIETENDLTANVPKIEKPKEKNKSGEVEITPKKDWNLHCPPHVVNKQLEKGVKITIPEMFLKALKSEKVID